MSLISDPDYLIHSLRLNYLRNVEDPYGPRLISLDPNYDANPYVFASGLADIDKWPELAMPSSPTPDDDEAGGSRARINGQSGFPGATGLKYTTTIMGPSRVGGMGMRVSGKRGSVSRPSIRYSLRSEGEATTTIVAEEKHGVEELPAVTAPTAPASAPTAPTGTLKSPDKNAIINGRSSVGNVAPVHRETEQMKPISPEFHPKFKGAEEMEARRKLRMLARAHPELAAKANVSANLNAELSSSESESGLEGDEDESEMPDEEDEEFDLIEGADDGIEIDADDFEPDFAASRGMSGLGMHSDESGVSLLSDTPSGMLTSAASGSFMASSSVPPTGSSSADAPRGMRLSPVRETRNSDERHVDDLPTRPEESAPIDLGFDMVVPAPKAHISAARPKQARPTPLTPTIPRSPPSAVDGDLFARRPVGPIVPAKSALTALLAATANSSSSNPFTELYSAISARSDGDSVTVLVYFPHTAEPAGHPLELKIRKDATVEEVLGFALWTYWEEGWLPKIDEGLKGEEDSAWETRCSAVGWILRIAEDDGEVDEDFPPPDRTGKISKFNFDAYAVLAATPAQIQQNKTLESKIQRRPSRIVVKKKSTGFLNVAGVNTTLVPPVDSFAGTSAGLSSLASSVGMFPSSLGPSSSHGPPQFLRIRIADTADAGHVSTTIQASGGMYMAEVLEAACQKRKLNNSKDYALVLDLGTAKVYIPLDRTVKSLQGKRDLILMKKNMLQTYGVEISHNAGRTTDPNASIIKRNSEALEPVFSSIFDYTNAYRKYTVYRKVPMLVTRSARLLAIDGGYIHIIPQSNKAKHVFDGGKTSSYHLKSVVACQLSSKNSSTFKLVVHSNAARNKRYDFEAESPKIATEIVQTIRSLKTAMERPGTIKQSRRSRHGA
ncbi:uncharacterized protein LAESUDRAFT_755945 [Laetiporus sulphureus 93-53]|uniref:SIN1-domain-containing protein n=1 Tax=Laetiporus sulphureus 93-53 TaxID=1314785 RepID=A0A165GJF2_9APHY|nr:uncharacterized protein LAESUDRAFT_755945 [Laetiporus sulphureus 93-53]KZT10435.1 hypothetical protein LAESUDRAFT_755945 [Laetiporus sulphureus 93-53]